VLSSGVPYVLVNNQGLEPSVLYALAVSTGRLTPVLTFSPDAVVNAFGFSPLDGSAVLLQASYAQNLMSFAVSPSGKFEMNWNVSCPGRNGLVAVGGDGTVLVGSNTYSQGALIGAFDGSTGALLWAVSDAQLTSVVVSLAVGGSGVVYAAILEQQSATNHADVYYSLSGYKVATGQQLFNTTFPEGACVIAQPAIGVSGSVYVVADYGYSVSTPANILRLM
jgi:hypothetical protein